MLDSILPENEPQIQPRNPYPLARPGPIPDGRLDGIFVERPVPALVVRDESSTTTASPSATFSCAPNDNSGPCEKYYNADGSGNTLPIVLGVVIPLGIAIVILVWLHRRHVVKLRQEDANDKHKSLDFGMGEGRGKSRKPNARGRTEMSASQEKEIGGPRERGLSMDLEAHNPYVLPPALNHSRESLHSLSRSITGDDKYRATNFIPDDGSIRPASSIRSPLDDSSSTFTGSSSRRFNYESKHNLLSNAQGNPLGSAVRDRSMSSSRDPSVDPSNGLRTPYPPSNNNLLAPTGADSTRDSFLSTASSTGNVNALRASNNYLGKFISGGAPLSGEQSSKKAPAVVINEVRAETPAEEVRPPPVVLKDDIHLKSAPSAPEEKYQQTPSITFNNPTDRQPRLPQLSFIDPQGEKQSSPEPGLASEVTAASVIDNKPSASAATSMDHSSAQHYSQQSEHLSQNYEDQYEDADDYYEEEEVYGDYYQEYENHDGYDQRRSMMGMRPLPPDDPSENPEDRANRIRSFYKEYFDDSKPQNFTNHGGQQHGGYYEEQEGYYDNHGQDGYYDQGQQYPPRGGTAAGAYGRHRATVSNGSYMSGPRAYSSVSGRYGPPPPRAAAKRREVPLKTLHVLPTPHLLKDDTFLPIDYAPPKKISNQRSGTPDSLRGGERPYSPSVRAHNPLISSFDDLAVIPSP
ncbi:hypothetical protein LTR84_001583 [Exophiala bonariae]|uniref:Uncharacterized protein n=1 Tax=Exophiala bonariae TaxID=1690606 RepID=A0AAV9NF85_9EURO|nr:hypothetical protein LTR84_001583 [Exophiala bonariae]